MGKVSERILGIEGGGTKTGWVMLEREGGKILAQGKLPPANFRLATPDRLRSLFRKLPSDADRIGIFLAGCGTDEDRRTVEKLGSEVWPDAKIVAGSDRVSGVAAALKNGDGIAVNAGTGSSVTGRRGVQIEQAGGWGHILGDAGGGYFLSVQALRLLLREYDLHRGEMDLAAAILHSLSLNNFDELVRWAQAADKMEVAMLTPVVFDAAEDGDTNVNKIIRGGARALAEYTEAVARRLGLSAPEVKLLGGLFLGRASYADAFRDELAALLPEARIEVAQQAPEYGAAWLAAEMKEPLTSSFSHSMKADSDGLAKALTEQRNPRSEAIGQMEPREIAALFVAEESYVQDALRERITELAAAIELVASGLRDGGRLFYVGAGTSGRLGILDASEMRPTFGVASDLVQGIVAGGVTALHRSAEGAEDDSAAGSEALIARGVAAADVVFGITASGRTPFVLGTLARAKELEARTILLTCNPDRDKSEKFDVEIDLATGPELLTGSTRLKAGTATKVALNIVSTGAMIMLGKVHSNLMIDLTASNTKLRDRAARILAELARCDYDDAIKRLELHAWNLRRALEADRKATPDGDTPRDSRN
jgi:N-acetylmuramic acid 6-phosphate etherase